MNWSAKYIWPAYLSGMTFAVPYAALLTALFAVDVGNRDYQISEIALAGVVIEHLAGAVPMAIYFIIGCLGKPSQNSSVGLLYGTPISLSVLLCVVGLSAPAHPSVKWKLAVIGVSITTAIFGCLGSLIWSRHCRSFVVNV